MTKLALKIYDFMRMHKKFRFLSFVLLTACLLCLLLRLNFKEDISDFLPLDGRHQEAMQVYQDVSGASKIVAIFQSKDSTDGIPDRIVSAIGCFENAVAEQDTAGLVRNLTTQIDFEKISEISDFVYSNIPYFLTDEDYAHIDSLLDQPGYLARQLERDKELLMFPTSGMLSANLRRDPLNLFSPVAGKLQNGSSSSRLETYDGYLFAPGMNMALVMLESPFGNSETRHNAVLMDFLRHCAHQVEAEFPGVSVHYVGGPAVAVANAAQIKKDSLLSIAIAAVLIVALLIIVFRKAWNIVMIVISVGWGWLFAMAMVSLVHDSVSLIVVGISSIILGIAVNYPLHMIAHVAHSGSMRQALREIIAPLTIGNITTVGAFAALVPLKAAALRDLGIFSAFILLGTILFVAVYLPHAVRKDKVERHEISAKWLNALSGAKIENNRHVVWGVVILTAVFAYFSSRTEFDADMSHINFMTDQQKADMMCFSKLTSNTDGASESLFVVSRGKSLDEALDASAAVQPQIETIASAADSVTYSSCARFLPSVKQQEHRLKKWKGFVAAHKDLFTVALPQAAEAAGFQKTAFEPFAQIVKADYASRELSFFAPLSAVNSRYLSIDSAQGKFRVVDMLTVPRSGIGALKGQIEKLSGQQFCFDVQSMNSAIANSLSDNFNYIGWACGLIVFFFLWASFASVELALLSFFPMAVSWIWILGIMGMTGVQFNIVNIILATFIFGQGDDYTIFMTEGCCYEYGFRKKMLSSYKGSILVSALIMFTGIGTLIFAKHPALHSLAEVTIVGMLSVVLMAYLLPPLVFNWITRSHGDFRRRPLTLAPLLRWCFGVALWWGMLLCGCTLGFLLFVILRRKPEADTVLHRFVTWSHRAILKLLPGVRLRTHDVDGEALHEPCVIICNNHSLFNFVLLLTWSPKILLVHSGCPVRNTAVKAMAHWLGMRSVKQPLESGLELYRSCVSAGYSIAFCLDDEDDGNCGASAPHCHEQPFWLAEKLGLDVLPMLLHGVDHILPAQGAACYRGEIHMFAAKRITHGSQLWDSSSAVMAKKVQGYMADIYKNLCGTLETAAYFVPLVKDRYRYKGTEIMRDVAARLKSNSNYSAIINCKQPPKVVINNCGYGEMPLLMALVHPDVQVIAVERDEEKLLVARYAAEGIAQNIEFKSTTDDAGAIKNIKTYELSED